eukprot:6087247-Pleurochrysis_carterae.AAC.1
MQLASLRAPFQLSGQCVRETVKSMRTAVTARAWQAGARGARWQGKCLAMPRLAARAFECSSRRTACPSRRASRSPPVELTSQERARAPRHACARDCAMWATSLEPLRVGERAGAQAKMGASIGSHGPRLAPTLRKMARTMQGVGCTHELALHALSTSAVV